jgi:lactate 2-monooxygenase
MAQSDQLLARVLGNGPRTYASYSSQIYFNKYSTGQSPTITTDFEKLEASAKTRLPPEAYDYAAGGAGMSRTMKANRDAFDKVIYPSTLPARI